MIRYHKSSNAYIVEYVCVYLHMWVRSCSALTPVSMYVRRPPYMPLYSERLLTINIWYRYWFFTTKQCLFWFLSFCFLTEALWCGWNNDSFLKICHRKVAINVITANTYIHTQMPNYLVPIYLQIYICRILCDHVWEVINQKCKSIPHISCMRMHSIKKEFE